MLDKNSIIEHLNTLHEHKMAKDIFVPVLKKMRLKGVKFTGGPDEHGVDIEYYEPTQPENDRSYVGIQFKKGDLVYSGGGSKNSVKEVRNQAEEAFEKEIHDIDGHSTRYISRFIVATTGDINEPARKFIGRARQKGQDRRIDYWAGDRLAKYIQDHWMNEFVNYFKINTEEADEYTIVDIEYIEGNYEKLVRDCQRVRSTVNGSEWTIIMAIFGILVETRYSSVPLADLLLKLGRTEDYYRDEFEHLFELNYIYADESGFSIDGHARKLWDLFFAIGEEIQDAGEEPESTIELFTKLLN